jgi:GNAT superfamily N-acetyltransferase
MKEIVETRPAKEQDASAIAEIWIGQMRSPPYNLTMSDDEALDAIRGYISSVDLTVAVLESEVVGFCAASLYRYIDGYRVWISELHVRKGMERQGIGGALIHSLEERFRPHGARVMELLSHESSDASRFYEAKGFVTTRFRKCEKRI